MKRLDVSIVTETKFDKKKPIRVYLEIGSFQMNVQEAEELIQKLTMALNYLKGMK